MEGVYKDHLPRFLVIVALRVNLFIAAHPEFPCWHHDHLRSVSAGCTLQVRLCLAAASLPPFRELLASIDEPCLFYCL
jgi:hypothetical protein